MITWSFYWLFLVIVFGANGQSSKISQSLTIQDNCDDVEVVKDVLSYECLQLCLVRRWCTHYTWSPEGICYLKKKKRRINSEFCNKAESALKINSNCSLMWILCVGWTYLLNI